MEELEAMKSDFTYYEATVIQKIVLGFVYRRRLSRQVRAAIKIQSIMRMALERQEYILQPRAICKIQRKWRYCLTVASEDAFQDDSMYSGSEMEENPVSDDGENDKENQWNNKLGSEDDLTEDDEGFGSDYVGMPVSKSNSILDRIDPIRESIGPSATADELARNRAESIKRLKSLGACAKKLMDKQDDSLEHENASLRDENRQLRSDLDLMREQCLELQAIVVDLNRNRFRAESAVS